jgi:hypothetical protein
MAMWCNKWHIIIIFVLIMKILAENCSPSDLTISCTSINGDVTVVSIFIVAHILDFK